MFMCCIKSYVFRQILRSASQWSAGIKVVEHSIMNAYVEIIRYAEHFIYIEVSVTSHRS